MIFPDNTTFPGLNAAGMKLLDTAVLWAAEKTERCSGAVPDQIIAGVMLA